jgi:hypothetical protein
MPYVIYAGYYIQIEDKNGTETALSPLKPIKIERSM